MGRRRAGLGDFTPGLESAKAAGIVASRAPYPAGDEGIQLSLETVARKVREGALDPGIIELAHKIFVAAGFSGRGSAAGTTRERIHSLLEYVRSWLIYAPDQPGTERITSAAALACIRPGLCVRIGDCFPQGTLLLRDDYALVPIEEIKIGDKIWGLDKWTTIRNVWFTGRKTIDTMILNNGSQVPLSREHHVYVARCRSSHAHGCRCPMSNRKLVRTQFSDLQPGDALPQPDRIPFGTGEMDPARAYVEGLYVSEGWGDERRFSISGQDGCRKEAQKHEVKAICERLGVPTRWHRKYITVNDKDWAQRVSHLGQRARFKHVETINLAEAPLVELLRGVMADSTPNTNGGGRTFSTTSDLLMAQTRVMHRMFGRSASARLLTPAMHKGAGKHSMWRLGIRDPNNPKAEKLLRVRDVERGMGKMACWDVTTEDGFVYLPAHDVTVSNCDDCCILLGSLLGAAGIPVRIVKQDYGGAHQQHVLVEAFDDGAGVWLYADPSTDMPLGTAAHAASEQRIDPLDLKVTGEGSSGAEIITLGRAPMKSSQTIGAQTVLYGGRWWHRDGLGRVSVHDGSAWQPIPLGLGECNINPALNFPPGCWSPVADGSVTQGLRYFIIAIAPANWSASDVSAYFKDWLLEGVTPRGTGSWGVRGLARVSGALGSTGAVSIAGVFKEDAPQPGPGPNPNPLPPPREPPDNGPPLGTIFLTTAAIAGGIGVGGWLLYKSGLLHAFKKHLK